MSPMAQRRQTTQRGGGHTAEVAAELEGGLHDVARVSQFPPAQRPQMCTEICVEKSALGDDCRKESAEFFTKSFYFF